MPTRESVFGGALPTALVCGLGICALFGDCFREKSIMLDDADAAVDIQIAIDSTPTFDAGSRAPVTVDAIQPSGSKVLSVMSGGREVLWFGKTPGAIYPVYPSDGGVLGNREWNAYLKAQNDATDYSRIYVRQPDGGTAYVGRDDAGVWIAHGITCAP